MLRKLIPAALLLTCLPSFAAERSFEIVYTGFYSEDFGEFQPDKQLEVFITVDDVNGDGVYALEELKALSASRINYIDSCSSIHCVDLFTWAPGDLPSYSARYQSNDGFTFELTGVVTGHSYREFLSNTWGFQSSYTWKWTDATRTTITQISPVPEPAGYAMLGAGLAVIVLGRRRRLAA